jgi:hypothetical protein
MACNRNCNAADKAATRDSGVRALWSRISELPGVM